jgi:hypothetical protein
VEGRGEEERRGSGGRRSGGRRSAGGRRAADCRAAGGRRACGLELELEVELLFAMLAELSVSLISN